MSEPLDAQRPIGDEILAYYGTGGEADRLSQRMGPLEFARSQELITRYLPPPPATIYDVGGGPGAYSFWLASLGYSVHLVDILPLHIEQAVQVADDPSTPHLTSMTVGDARTLGHPDNSAHALILHGPLYHLTRRQDRLAALAEAKRILRPGGLLFAFAITRYASTFAGLSNDWIWDSDYFEMITEELTTGQHRQPPNWPSLFTTAYFHHPDDLEAELLQVGMILETTLGIQGPAWVVSNFDEAWQDPQRRDLILRIARMMEGEPAVSPHMVAVARKGT